MVVDFQLDEQAGCVQGHFPGAPVVPGAWLLAFIDQQVRAALPGQSVAAFGKVKFLAPLRPRQAARLVGDFGNPGKVKFEIRVDDRLVLQASATLADTPQGD